SQSLAECEQYNHHESKETDEHELQAVDDNQPGLVEDGGGGEAQAYPSILRAAYGDLLPPLRLVYMHEPSEPCWCFTRDGFPSGGKQVPFGIFPGHPHDAWTFCVDRQHLLNGCIIAQHSLLGNRRDERHEITADSDGKLLAS